MIKVDCISDLHGYYPKLEGGDLLIVAGDLTAKDSIYEHSEFLGWLNIQNYKKKIFISGNHDNYLVKGSQNFYWDSTLEYLCDSGTEFEGLKIWGSPWTLAFKGMNPKCKAFTVETDEELADKWALIADDIDILVTHSPSFGNYDAIKNADGSIGQSVGSLSLWYMSLIIKPKVHIFGHIHEGYGHSIHANGIHLINASHVNERYEPVNKPIRIEL